MDVNGFAKSNLTFLETLQKWVTFAGGGFEGRLILSRPLDYESLSNFNVTLRVSDHGKPPLYSDTNLHISVIDSDDLNPRLNIISKV